MATPVTPVIKGGPTFEINGVTASISAQEISKVTLDTAVKVTPDKMVKVTPISPNVKRGSHRGSKLDYSGNFQCNTGPSGQSNTG